MSRLFLLFLLVSFQSVLKALETASDTYTQEVKKGERNLLDLTKKAEIYGECWHDALQSLNMECRHLNSKLQSKLALKFTNCFLIDSGKPVCPCGPGELISNCLGLCSDITFNTYTHFYTYTHSMCFFIRHKIFESEIAKSTLYLNTLAQKLNTQLDIIIENNTQHQNILLDHLNKSVNEIKLLDAEITRSREQTNQLFTDFKKVTANNTNLILKLYSKINDVKIFFIRELDFIYSVIFYLGLFIFLYFISSHKYLKNSRFALIVLTILFPVIEYYINSIFLKMNLNEENRLSYIWKLRLLDLAASVAVLIRYYYSYLDYPIANYNMLQKMTVDMAEIKLLLHTLQTRDTASVNTAPSSHKKQILCPDVRTKLKEQESMFPTVDHVYSSHSALGSPDDLENYPASSLSSLLANEERNANENEDVSWLSQIQSALRGDNEDLSLRHLGASKSEVSIRPDGTIRPLVRVKEGYTPPNFVADEDLVNSIYPVDLKTEQRKLEKKLAEIRELKVLKSRGFLLSAVQEDKIESLERVQNQYNQILEKL